MEKEKRCNQKLIRGKNEWRTSLTHQIPEVYSLALSLYSVLLFFSGGLVTLFPFSRPSRLGGKVSALAKTVD